jgi:hypothetical protein
MHDPVAIRFRLLWTSGAQICSTEQGRGLRSRAHPADKGFEPAASSRRIFLLDSADLAGC